MVSIWTIALFLLGAAKGERQHACPLGRTGTPHLSATETRQGFRQLRTGRLRFQTEAGGAGTAWEGGQFEGDLLCNISPTPCFHARGALGQNFLGEALNICLN